MFSLAKNTILQFSRKTPHHNMTSMFHSFSLQNFEKHSNQFLMPKLYNAIQICGLKVKGFVKKRCKDCFMVMRDGRMYVECKTYGRHKQVTIAKKPKNTWMLSHATQSKVRPW